MTTTLDASRRRLGATDITVSPVALGTAPLGGLFGGVDADEGRRFVRSAIDDGIDVVDTSSFYGNAEELLGQALEGGYRDRVTLITKAGHAGESGFDFRPVAIRESLERSLTLLGTDRVDVFLLHDIEYADFAGEIVDAWSEAWRLQEEGKCRYIGVSAYPMATLRRAIVELRPDVVLSYASATLLDDSLTRELLPLAGAHGVGVMNAAAVALGLLTKRGVTHRDGHPATPAIQESAAAMVRLCDELGLDVSDLANRYSIQRSGAATTVVGTRSTHHLAQAVDAASAPLDDAVVARVLSLRPPETSRRWISGLPANN